MKHSIKVWRAVHTDPDNVSIDVLNPEQIAQESLMILENEMVMANLVHRDFENMIAKSGDVVNAHRPASFTATRKATRDAVSPQAATVESVPVKLNQHLVTSFLIADGEESMAFTDLVQYFLRPAVQSIAQMTDELLCCQLYRFLANGVGKLGTDGDKALVVSAREALNTLKCPLDGNRYLVIPPNIEGNLLNVADFVNAHTRGDDGSVMRSGHLGSLLGFETFMSQNMPQIAAGSTVSTAAINNGNLAAGSTVLTIDGTSLTLAAGTFITVAGDMTPQLITAATGTPTTSITVTPGLKSAVLNDAVITVYTPGAINNSPSGYAIDYGKALTVNGFSVAPKPRQGVYINGHYYGALQTPTTTSLLLDRPLAAAGAHAAVVGLAPAGDYGLAFHRDAIGLVTRPLAMPMRGTGALGYVASYNGLSIRVVITYQGRDQGHLVTVDMLGGVAQYDSALAVPVFA